MTKTLNSLNYLKIKRVYSGADSKILEEALQIKTEDQAGQKRNLAQILVQEFNFDHDTIFREVAVLYARS